jgi:signal transduction histidine kinase
VLANLAHNAAQAGARRIEVDARGDGERVIIEVADDGPGIPAGLRPELFKPFAVSARNGGSGLGLAIAREIVRAHGGDLVLAATGPEGTVFRIELPAHRSRGAGPGRA